ncbi:amidohydrolase [Nonomuraea sp. WAC 01424]|uniref:amidohydrolase n=1 Tax=Nonomuraea sp. WAC 01424 TaxID=2203200 RepID=UPI000F7A60E6|nr:amidohydrolase [Nonomuraea sp. WAC 01424]RSM98107.1 amidohydrolase [Nonomuraea sp. WAC 01424]
MTSADILFVNGRVRPMAGAPSRAVAVGEGRILALGDDEKMRDLAGPRTEVVDLAGRTLLPGFQDAHVHPVLAGLSMTRCDLHEARDAADALAVVRAYAAANPETRWISGGGWSMEWFPGGTPSRAALDEVVPDRPVYLINRDGHGAWVNTEALRLCGVDDGTPDPADGRIEREPDGTPQGTLHEGAASLVGRHVPEPTDEDLLRGLQAGQRRLHQAGVTAWQDAMVSPEVQRAYEAAADASILTGRVVGALWWDRDRGEEQIPDLLARRTTTGRFRAASVKIMQDGVAENYTAAMTSPYLDGCGCRTGNSGISFIGPADLRAHITRLDAVGVQVHVHAVGDRAAQEALDAFEAALKVNGRKGNRHHIAHLQVVHPDDVPRFAALEVTANIQPLWAAHEPQMDELTIPFLGDRRAAWQYPFGDLLRAVAALAAGSDWPVSSPDPFLGIHVAVNRMLPDGSGRPFLPAQRLPVAAALSAYTIGTARINHLDTRTGTIEPGKLADFIVTDADPFAVPPGDLGGITVLATYVEGRRVHTHPSF